MLAKPLIFFQIDGAEGQNRTADTGIFSQLQEFPNRLISPNLLKSLHHKFSIFTNFTSLGTFYTIFLTRILTR